jgi:hypothetical protein
VFADGVARKNAATGVLHHPTEQAFGPDSSLCTVDVEGGRLYRIVYAGHGPDDFPLALQRVIYCGYIEERDRARRARMTPAIIR